MPTFELKIINNRLVIDMNKLTEDYSEAYGYDGLPSKYDVEEIGCTEPFATIELSEHQYKRIMAEYENGGECDWCGEIKKELRGPHLMDFVPGKKICRDCWNLDRGNYLGVLGEDIGPFDENDKSKPCVQCNEFLVEKEQLHLNDEKVICDNCAQSMNDLAT